MTSQIYKSTNHRWRRVSCQLLLALTLGTVPVQAQDTFALNRKVSVHAKKTPISNVLEDLEKQTNLNFVYDGSQLDRSTTITLNADNKSLKDVLNALFPKGSEYRVVGNQLVVKKGMLPIAAAPIIVQQKNIRIVGNVVLRDNKGDLQMMQGVNVRVKGQNTGTVTNTAGQFEITAPENGTLVFSFIGYKQKEVSINGRSSMKITLEEDISKIQEVVVTGIFERPKESFTGSAATYSGQQLKTVGNQNVIQSLRSLDPAFSVFENNRFGSNPNVMPDMEIQGRTNILGLKEQLGADLNLPLFILDGFPVPLQTIMDLDINRVENLTLLKDAASTAIYGSRAANGVIVIETKKPKAGELRVTYTNDNQFSVPDLRDYNLMNAAEKLEFERLSGRYTLDYPFRYYYDAQIALDNLYNEKLAEVRRGVNTYWMNEPLRKGFSNSHSLYLEGGDNQMRYGVGVNYKKINGVMKGSSRDVGGGNIKLIYRKGKLSFQNNLSLNFFTANESPYGNFSNFSRANPYYRKRNPDGSIPRILETAYTRTGTLNYIVNNPLWDAMLPNSDVTRNFNVINNLQAEWAIRYDLRFRARFGVNRTTEEREEFTSALHSRYILTPLLERGAYTNNSKENLRLDGDVSFTFGRVFAEKHLVNAVAGWSFSDDKKTGKGYSAVGFPDYITSPAFAASYFPNGKPVSNEATARSTSFFLQGGYAYNNRFLLDYSYRLDGASNYGVNKLFTNTWSLGAAWNLHEEAFFGKDLFNLLKVRASIGNPGNENGIAYQSFTTFNYNTANQNYFGIGANIASFGNPDLDWQKTIKKTIGIDGVVKERLRFNFDYVLQNADPLVAVISLPASVGSSVYTTNIGAQTSKGFNFIVSFSPIYLPKQGINWSVSISGKQERAHYENIGNKLDVMNKLNQSKNLDRYYDMGSPTALWAVRSQGIDPGSGREVFVKKDGTLTFQYDYADEVVVGDSRPDLDGVLGTTLFYKGFNLGGYIRYRMGGDEFNTALYNKVENINMEGLKINQDKRALYDRWKKAGDRARFRSISLLDQTNISSRFVQEENTFSGESINLGYEFPNRLVQKWRLSYVKITGYMNDIFRISSIKRERGIDYPFANMLSLSLSVGF